MAMQFRSAQQTVTETTSLQLTKNLLRASISSIAYMRNLFPKDCFVEMKADSATGLKKLKGDGTVKEVNLMIQWMEKGVFEALEKKYLSSITFEITDSPPAGAQHLLETYTFDVEYPGKTIDPTICFRRKNDSGKTFKSSSKQELTGFCSSMLSSLMEISQKCENLGPLPDQRNISLKLAYNDMAPRDYEPAYFRPATEADDHSWFSDDPLSYSLDGMATPFHGVGISVRSCANATPKANEKSPKSGTESPTRPMRRNAKKKRSQLKETVTLTPPGQPPNPPKRSRSRR